MAKKASNAGRFAATMSRLRRWIRSPARSATVARNSLGAALQIEV
jgi:hypothetical protein